MFLILNIPIC